MAGTALVPTLLVTIPVGVTLSIQFAVLAGQVGAESLSGAANGLVVIRQGAPLVAAILLAAAVGSAVSADLGSRTMREEIDAMEVMGVSVIRRLVVPRFAALILVGVALTGLATRSPCGAEPSPNRQSRSTVRMQVRLCGCWPDCWLVRISPAFLMARSSFAAARCAASPNRFRRWVQISPIRTAALRSSFARQSCKGWNITSRLPAPRSKARSCWRDCMPKVKLL